MTKLEKTTAIAIVILSVICFINFHFISKSVQKHGLKSIVEQLWNGAPENKWNVICKFWHFCNCEFFQKKDFVAFRKHKMIDKQTIKLFIFARFYDFDRTTGVVV